MSSTETIDLTINTTETQSIAKTTKSGKMEKKNYNCNNNLHQIFSRNANGAIMMHPASLHTAIGAVFHLMRKISCSPSVKQTILEDIVAKMRSVDPKKIAEIENILDKQ